MEAQRKITFNVISWEERARAARKFVNKTLTNKAESKNKEKILLKILVGKKQRSFQAQKEPEPFLVELLGAAAARFSLAREQPGSESGSGLELWVYFS